MDFGTHLKAAREERRIGLDTVSARTKIHQRLLIDLEANDLSRWPKQKVYRHGFLRSYARAVGLNTEDLVRRFDEEFADQEPPVAPAVTVRPPKSRQLPLTKSAAALAMVGGLIVGIGLSKIDRHRAAVGSPVARSAPHVSNVPLQPEKIKFVPAQIPAEPTAASIAQPTAAIAQPAASIAPAPASIALPATTVVPPPSDDASSNIEGDISVVSNPPGAWITVNGIGYGTTPMRIQFLRLRSYDIRLIEPGYSIAETRVALTADRPNRTVTVSLRPDPALAAIRANASDAQADRAQNTEP